MRASCRYPVRFLTFPGGFSLSPQGLTASGYFDASQLHCLASANTLEGGSLYQFYFSDFDGLLSDEMEGQAESGVVFYYRLVPRGRGSSALARANVYAYDASRHELLPASRIVPLSPQVPGALILDHAGRPIGHAFDTASQPVTLRIAGAGARTEWFRPVPALADDPLILDADGTARLPRGASGDFLVVCHSAEASGFRRAGRAAAGDDPVIAFLER